MDGGKLRFGQIVRFFQKPDPIVGLYSFFQSDAEFGDKIRAALGLLSFYNIGPDAGTAPEQLFRKDILLFIIYN